MFVLRFQDVSLLNFEEIWNVSKKSSARNCDTRNIRIFRISEIKEFSNIRSFPTIESNPKKKKKNVTRLRYNDMI